MAIAKSRFVWTYYASSRAMNYPDGIPIQYMETDKALADFLIEHFLLQEGFVYSIHGFTNGKTASHVKQTKSLMKLEVFDSENLKYNISGTGRLNRYWFRRQAKKKPERSSDFG